ncbi:MAG: cobaltochelatase subunit CobN [Cyanobacteria bacterium J06627_28]
MHRLAATPGGWDSELEGVIVLEQSAAPIVLLTAADTDIATLAQTLPRLPNDFCDVRSVSLLQLQQQLTIDTYAEEVLKHARLIVVRLLGGRAYWSYGLEVVRETAAASGAMLVVIPGDDRPDIALMSHSTAPLNVVNQLWQYFNEGGVTNLCNGLLYSSNIALATGYRVKPPKKVPKIGIYPLKEDATKATLATKKAAGLQTSLATDIDVDSQKKDLTKALPLPIDKNTFAPIEKKSDGPLNLQSFEPQKSLPIDDNQPSHETKGFLSNEKETVTLSAVSSQFQKETSYEVADDSDIYLVKNEIDKKETSISAHVGILFYRAHYLAGNTKLIDAIAQSLSARGLIPVPIYVSSLKAVEVQQALIQHCQSVELLINTTSFAITHLSESAQQLQSKSKSLWQMLDIPVLQAICSGSPREQWQKHPQGLTPRDIAMNVALPEVDGRIITRAVSFKAAQTEALASNEGLQTPIVMYEPERDRVEFVADLAANWLRLRRTAVCDRKIALILANYPNRDGRMANGVGLDTPASCLEILKSLKQAGYTVVDLPETGDALMAQLAATATNDPEGYGLRPVNQTLSAESYQAFFSTLPPAVQSGVTERWGDFLQEWQRFYPVSHTVNALPIAGIQFGNVFVGIQPSRGYDIDPSLNYHAPDLEPTHAYLGFYHWLRQQFAAHAMVHVGKHGNLEWLPGKGIALTEACYPEAAFGAMPHFYPFIVNDPGEGAQAKRRAQAVILDHLTPPMTRAELYGPLQQLESLVDEYYEAQNLDPTRLKIIGPKIVKLLESTQLREEISLSSVESFSELQSWLPQIDGYLCELKEAQIRDGLHIFGLPPQGEQVRDLMIAIARHPNSQHMGLSRAIAQSWNLDLDPLTADPAQPYKQKDARNIEGCRNIGDIIERIEQYATQLIDRLLSPQSDALEIEDDDLKAVLDWVSDWLVPTIANTTNEIDNLLHGLNGGYVPSGPSGAPTRNRPEVLPTGRNFYSVDIRAIPTESAWDVGRKAAEILIENYTQEEGEYPKTLGLSMWGTSAMRTGGDDMAQALALLGVRPLWDGPSRRVIDFEILPLSLLGRPRVDVTLRISGFFRDAFPNLISLFNQAVTAVAALDEPPEQNPLADQVQKDFVYWQRQGLDDAQSEARSRYRIFGSKPGAYGAGLQGLIEAQNWESDADLARAYVNWSSYAYVGGKSGSPDGHSAPESFSQRLENMQIVLQNQDNREHDLLDSDDYYQFQGGLTAAVKTKRGEAPKTYFGDNAVPENPKVRSLKSEIARVYRSRVVNPKWIKGVMRHGYKGAFEMAATVDYMFAYDATTGCVENHMYTGVAEAYVFDADVRAFIEKSNPWALRDMAERLLEAEQRGLWENVDEKMVDGLRAIAHEAEGKIEAGLSTKL